MATQLSTANKKNNTQNISSLWWLLGIIAFILCILIQMPISWIIQKVAPNTPYLQWTSGNLWQGSANWQVPITSGNVPNNSDSGLSGSLSWQWKPLYLVTGNYTADVEINTEDSQLTGRIGLGLIGGLGEQWHTKQLSGQIGHTTLSQLLPWQPIPEAPIKINNTSLSFKKDQGYSKVDGNLTWLGGNLGYTEGNKTYQIALPSMNAQLSDKENVLNIQLVNDAQKRLGLLTLDKDAMLDINLTQRLLENMPEYKGSAPKDTAVVSLRQPLASLGEQ